MQNKVIIPDSCKNRGVLHQELSSRKNLILQLHGKHKINTSEQLNELIDKELNPDENLKIHNKTIAEHFDNYINRSHKDGVFGENRKKQYRVLQREIERFLIINKLKNIKASDFTAEIISLFKDFLANEYILVKKYPILYQEIKNPPTKIRSQNTIATKLKKLQAFFNELENLDEIQVSPFRKLGKQCKSVMMREQYDEPIFLTKVEFRQIQMMEVLSSLQEVKDVFLLQCSLGCRIGDFQRLSFENIFIEEGIPYIHYLPQKTKNEGEIRKEIKTPLMSFALEIIKKYNFTFPILKYVSGERGYDVKIKQLLELCEISRPVAIFNEHKSQNEYKPLFEVASSKLARKTHIDILNKVQVDRYVAGLHKKGSSAVNHYTFLNLRDRFNLMCVAFECEPYKVDIKLNII